MTLQERLRAGAFPGHWGDLQIEAANRIDALEADVAEYRQATDDQAMKHKVERDEVLAQIAALREALTAPVKAPYAWMNPALDPSYDK